MERKIMSLGILSLVVSLPKHWVQLNGLKKGDVVSLAVQRDRSLVIFPSAEKKKNLKRQLFTWNQMKGKQQLFGKL